MNVPLNSKAGMVPFQIEDPARIPAQRYYDEQFYRLECERLWPRVWQMACRLEQIPNVGDWIEYSNVGKSVIVVQTMEGVKAYDNACRHRGVQLVEGHGNCKTQGFICTFHGWRWNMEGKNTFVYGRHLFDEDQLKEAELTLRPCRVESWAGCAWINFDENAPSVRESFGPLAERLDAHAIDKLRAEWCYGTVLPANWKIAMEAFMEGYHVMRTHPQLQQAAPAMYNERYGKDAGGIDQHVDPKSSVRDAIMAQFRQMELLSEGMAGMVHAKEVEIARQMLNVELPDDPQQAVMTWYGMVQEQITKQLQAKGEPCPNLNEVAVSDPINAVEFLFPHYFLLPMFSSMSAYRIRPLGPESCLFEIWSLTLFPVGEEQIPPMEATMLPYDSKDFPPIPQQDYANIPRQQLGLHAEGFEYMRLSPKIEGLISNYQRIVDGYLRGENPQKLSQASAKLGGNFDGPILDLGL